MIFSATVGYVRGICRGDGDGSYVINLAGDKVTLPEEATDVSMAPYHVARSKLFVRERAAKALVHLDTAQIEANIEHTRFPVPEDESSAACKPRSAMAFFDSAGCSVMK
jgi:hypothetical protein